VKQRSSCLGREEREREQRQRKHSSAFTCEAVKGSWLNMYAEREIGEGGCDKMWVSAGLPNFFTPAIVSDGKPAVFVPLCGLAAGESSFRYANYSLLPPAHHISGTPVVFTARV
jgi:hypothetical protein